MKKIEKLMKTHEVKRCDQNSGSYRQMMREKLNELVDSVNSLMSHNHDNADGSINLGNFSVFSPQDSHQTKEPEIHGNNDNLALRGGSPLEAFKEPECDDYCPKCKAATCICWLEKPAKKECKVDCKVDDKSVVRDEKECEPNDCGVFYHSKDELAVRLEKVMWDSVPSGCPNALADESRKWAVEQVGKVMSHSHSGSDVIWVRRDELVARLKESK